MYKRERKKLFKRIAAGVAFFAMLLTSLGMPGEIPAYAEGDAAFEMDGLSEDWLHITPVFAGGGVITKLSAFTKDGTLYGKMELSSSANFDTWHIYFDTDDNATNHLYFTGADYLLETDILYVYEGDSGE
ncbi:MAG: hypothetical protein J6Z46_10120, partial [Lachnospiraceae bacterium]|nr:hypothetical protein [Lachnospiraceae bacterium]